VGVGDVSGGEVGAADCVVDEGALVRLGDDRDGRDGEVEAGDGGLDGLDAGAEDDE
jgi:hypothetical protein